jgi:hypothetical protein
MRILCRKAGNTLKPVDEAGFKVLGRIKQGDAVWVDVTRPRNLRQFQLYWALMQIVADNSDYYDSKEQVSDMMKVATGHTSTFIDHHGQIWHELKSISFDNMDQDTFNAYFDRCIDIIVRRFLPNLPEGDLRREVEDMCRVNLGGTP